MAKGELFTTAFHGFAKEEVLLYLKNIFDKHKAELEEEAAATVTARALCEKMGEQMNAVRCKLEEIWHENECLSAECEALRAECDTLKKQGTEVAVLPPLSVVAGEQEKMLVTSNEDDGQYAEETIAWIQRKLREVRRIQMQTQADCERLVMDARNEAAEIRKDGELQRLGASVMLREARDKLSAALIQREEQVRRACEEEQRDLRDAQRTLTALDDCLKMATVRQSQTEGL